MEHKAAKAVALGEREGSFSSRFSIVLEMESAAVVPPRGRFNAFVRTKNKPGPECLTKLWVHLTGSVFLFDGGI